MPDYSLVPVDYQPDFDNFSLVPVDYNPFANDSVTQLAQGQAQTQAQAPPTHTQPMPVPNAQPPLSSIQSAQVQPQGQTQQWTTGMGIVHSNVGTPEVGSQAAVQPTQIQPQSPSQQPSSGADQPNIIAPSIGGGFA